MLYTLYTAHMNDRQRAWFFAEYESARREEVIGVLLAIFLGGFGLHKFYLRHNTAGVLYLVFSFTGIPFLLGFIECFLMPRRVREYNAAQATYIARSILAIPSMSTHCPVCIQPLDSAAAFCTHCGAPTSPAARPLDVQTVA